jgi:penicillin-binding protein 2
MRKERKKDISPEDILIDQLNLPSFDYSQLEGRIVKPLSNYIFYIIIFFVLIVFSLFFYNAYKLQIVKGEFYNNKAENNRFETTPIFSARGIIYDRNKTPLAWNENISTTTLISASSTDNTQIRKYENSYGIGNLLGYIKFSKKDKNGFYINKNVETVGGIERYFNETLDGKAGYFYSEIDSSGKLISQNIVDLPENGKDIHLTIDYDMQKSLFETFEKAGKESNYNGGVALIADLRDGSILASVTYPDFDSNIMFDGSDVEKISSYINDPRSVFLNRYVDGLYAPGSIIKPVFALAGLHEGIVTPREKILSTGTLVVPNPYSPGNDTVFKDWKAHGYTDVREAIAVSSDVYFYTIGGGVPGKRGLGISKLNDYSKYFGLDYKYENTFFKTKQSVIPNPEWKLKAFDGDIWRLGDTYNSSIGQYGFSISPIQALGMTTILAKEGKDIPEFKIDTAENTKYIKIDEKLKSISQENYNEMLEGMRLTVTAGTAKSLNFPEMKLAGKTGTAQTGNRNQFINSWFIGFWPYTDPKYAIVYMLEKGPHTNTKGAAGYLREFIESCSVYLCDFENKNKKDIPRTLPETVSDVEIENEIILD